MGFSKDHAIIAQNSATGAAAIVAQMQTNNLEETLALFDAVRTHIFEGTLVLSERSDVTTPATGTFTKKSFERSGNSGTSANGYTDDAGAGIIMKFGKYAGRSIGDVYESDSEYITWLSEKSNNDFLRNKATEFIASRA